MTVNTPPEATRETHKRRTTPRTDSPVVWLLAFIGFVVVVVSFTTRYFFTASNGQLLLTQLSVLGILALGETFVVLTGEIDISVGSALSFLGVIAASLGRVWDWLSIPAVLAIGALVGACNGLVVTRLRVTSFVATLGMSGLLRGVTLLLTGGAPVSGTSRVLQVLGQGSLGMLPYQFVILVCLVAVLHFFLNRFVLGRSLYAVGDNQQAARLVGINVSAVKVFAFTMAGVMAAVAGSLRAGQVVVADPLAGQNMELDAIAATVIGGTSLIGGRGGVVGTLLGAVLMGLLRNVMVLGHLFAYWQDIVISLIIIVAVAADSLRRSRTGSD